MILTKHDRSMDKNKPAVVKNFNKIKTHVDLSNQIYFICFKDNK